MGLSDRFFKLFDHEVTMKYRVKIFLWYYRLLHSTFGGLTINSKDQLVVKKFWKAYGVVFGLLIGIWNCISLYFFSRTKLMHDLQEQGFIASYYLSITMKVLLEVRCIFIFWFLQIHGIKFFQMFYVYRIQKSRALVGIFCVWILHILIPLVIGVYQLLRSRMDKEGINLSKIFFILIQGFLNYSISWSISFLMWNISVVVYENLRKIENFLIEFQVKCKSEKKLFQVRDNYYSNNNGLKDKSLLSTNREIFFDLKYRVQVLDRSLSTAMVIDFWVALVVIMIQIYGFAQNNPLLAKFAALNVFTAFSEISRVVINCLANGLVYDQCDKIMTLLDNLDPNVFDEEAYRDLLAFKSMSRDVSFGFTIGGFASLRRTTLLSIFSFMMNYTVILIQTAKFM